MEMKFKVGDKVRIIENLGTRMLLRLTDLAIIGAECEVIALNIDEYAPMYNGYTVKGSFGTLWMPEDWLELVEELKPIEEGIEIDDFDGITVTLKYNGTDLDIESDVDMNPIDNVDAIYGAIDALYGLLGIDLDD